MIMNFQPSNDISLIAPSDIRLFDLAKTFKSITPSKKEIHKVKWGKGTMIRLEFNSNL